MQALDNNFTDENRQKCAEAARPLVKAVEELTTFASSPEFATKQAKISPKVRIGFKFDYRYAFIRTMELVARQTMNQVPGLTLSGEVTGKLLCPLTRRFSSHICPSL